MSSAVEQADERIRVAYLKGEQPKQRDVDMIRVALRVAERELAALMELVS